MSALRKGKCPPKGNSDRDSFSSSDSDDKNSNRDRNRSNGCASRYSYVGNFARGLLSRIPVFRGKNCGCLFFYFLCTCFLLGFLYLYALTVVCQMMKFLRILAHFALPASWLKSTREIVQEALAKYSADKLGLADYALESVGGSVLCSSETYFTKSGAMYSVFGIPLWYHSSSPREAIQPDVQPGKCWAMDGTHGYITVQLAMPIMVSAVSIEHIPREVAPSGRLDSAPRDFLIIGKERTATSPEVVLGKFTYRIDKEPIQVFNIKDPYCQNKSEGNDCPVNTKVFHIITLKILNNHGHPEFTCIYRLRVHGQPINTVPMD